MKMGEIGEHHRDQRVHKRRHGNKQQQNKKRHAANNSISSIGSIGSIESIESNNSNNSSNSSNNNKNNKNGSHQRCWDWMLVSGTNHYAKNRASFSTYRRVLSQAGGLKVLGTGTVKLQVIRSPEDPRTNTLVLDNVLHTPDAICNGISINQSFMVDNNLQIDCSRDIVYNNDTEEHLFYARGDKRRVVLAGDPQGESRLNDNEVYSLSMHASDGELCELDRRIQNQCF